MAEMDKEIYLNSSARDDGIIAFGKSPEREISDHQNGISRFGGTWRQPSYSRAYLKAARILIEVSKNKHLLDDMGLPIFFMQRHTIELFIKDVLDQLYDVAQMRFDLYPSTNTQKLVASKGQIKRLNSSHELEFLYADLVSTCKTLEYDFDSRPLNDLIKIIGKYETNPSWSRYSKSKSVWSHMEEEVSIPLVMIHDKLEIVIKELDHEVDGSESSLTEDIYREWNHLMILTHENES